MKNIICILLALVLSGAVRAQELPFVYYTPENEINPLPSASVQNIMQDDLGTIWLSVFSSGAVRYDGVKMQVYGLAEGLPSLTVMNIEQDAAGRLWILTDTGVAVSALPLSKYGLTEAVEFQTHLSGLPLAATSVSQIGVNCLAAGPGENVWVGTTGLGVIRYRYTGEQQIWADTIAVPSASSAENRTIYALHAAPDGIIWIGAENAVFRYHPQQQTLEKIDLIHASTHAITSAADGRVWGGQADGKIWQYSNGKFTFIETGIHSVIYDMRLRTDSDLWAVSYGDGVVRFNPDEPRQAVNFRTDHGLISNDGRAILHDKEGNLWLTMNGGICKLRPNFEAVRNISPQFKVQNKNLLPGKSITSFVPPPQGRKFPVWIGGGDGVVCWNAPEKAFYLNESSGLMSNTVYDIIEDRTGRIWIGDFYGLNCLSDAGTVPAMLHNEQSRTISFGGVQKMLTSFQTDIIGVCSSFDIDSQSQNEKVESLWFNSYRRLVCYVEEEWFIFDAQAGVPASIIYSVAQDKEGYLWLGTGDRGLFKSTKAVTIENLRGLSKNPRTKMVSETVFEPAWNMQNGAPENEFSSIVWIGDTLWTANSKSLQVISKGPWQVIKKFSTADGLLNNNIVNLQYQAEENTLWCGTNQGFAKINTKQLQVEKVISKEDGLVNNESHWLKSLRLDGDGRVYFGTPRGVSIYDPRKDTVELQPPTPEFSALQVQQALNGSNIFSAAWSGLSFVNERQVRYQTKLHGFDENWSDSTPQNSIRYTSLPAYFFSAGYEFKVRAANYRGKWSTEPLTYSFSIEPPWWLRWWAVILYMILIAIIYVMLRWLWLNRHRFIKNFPARIDEYKLIEKIGSGGMGEVFRALHAKSGEEIALKLLHEEMMFDEENKKRLFREGRFLSDFDHPNIIRARNIGEWEDRAYIAMELMKGGTLKEFLLTRHPLNELQIRGFVLQICRGLLEIHRHGIIHRDLKTGNLMLDSDSNIKIMDFGLSKSPLVTTMTSLGTVLGTLGYVAPDQITGMKSDQRVDIFSLGVVIYELFTNDLPFKGENEMALIHAIFNNTPKPIRAVRPETDPLWDEIVTKCLQREPEDRFQSVQEIIKLLDPA